MLGDSFFRALVMVWGLVFRVPRFTGLGFRVPRSGDDPEVVLCALGFGSLYHGT